MTARTGDEAPRPGGVFVGCERELSELGAGLDEAEDGRGSLWGLLVNVATTTLRARSPPGRWRGPSVNDG